jgi:hypothetical protein
MLQHARHERLKELFLDGGADFEASERARQGVLSTFADDFAKYSRRVPVENVRKVFESVPRQLGEKFTWAKVDREVRSAGLAAALDLLCKARVASKVRRTSGSGLPFGADADEKNFKALFLDVGLASLACDLRSRDLVGAEDLLLGNRGAVSEQFGETYRVKKEPFFGWVIYDLHHGTWRRFYAFTEEPQLNLDYVMPSFWCEHAPESPFTSAPMLAIKTEDGRITVDGDLFRIFKGDDVTERTLADEDDRRAVYQKYFGLDVT